MKPERWQQLDQLFHSASEYAPAERATFLDNACNGDNALRKEVEALIAAHEGAGSFIDDPAMDVEAREMAAGGIEESTLEGGESVSHYRIVSLLGSGGMGEVYLAEDTVLSRQVALKLLPEHFAADRERLRRFQQEARTASALNHPNIITIFETGELGGRHFIVTEFIDGGTLRQWLRVKGASTSSTNHLRLRELLDVAIQTADALAAAHEAGIVHRDIKPENIMLRRRDGYVKVLDFGLAKLTESPTVDSGLNSLNQTSAGMLMGTTRYMSPEQARGEKVDARTDIWSLGVVLYEMVAGSAPFNRSTPSEVIALILEREPPPLAEHARDVPAELQRIVSKSLAKNREARYGTVKDLLVDLRRLRQRLDVEAEIERTRSAPANAVATAPRQTPAATNGAVTVEASSVVRTTPSAVPLAGKIGWRKRGALLLLGLLVLGIGVGAYALYKIASTGDTPLQAFHKGQWSRLTTSGQVTLATLSPDGKYVAHAVDHSGQQSLRLRQVVTTSDREIVAPASVRYRGLTFSPDGNYIYYISSSPDTPQLALFQISTLGGEPKKLLVGLAGDIDHSVRATVRFSPDGKQIAFLRQEVGKETTALMIANADGTGERKITASEPEESIGFPAWSPDGHRIAYVVLNFETNQSTVFEAQVGDGSRKPLTSHQWRRIFGLEWLSDGSGLLMVAGQRTFVCQIWQLSLPAGEPHQLTNDLHDYVGMSLAADANILGVIKFEKHATIWVAPEADASRGRPVTSGAGVGADQLASSPDGREIVFRSNSSGNSDIWVVSADGGRPRQLTTNAGINNLPVVSPDGRLIIFLSDRSGVPHIWKMNIDGSDQKQLTNGSGEQCPQFSPDGRWVFYSTVAAKSLVWRIPTDGGEPLQITDEDSGCPSISPDGKLLAYVYKDETSLWRIAIAPFEGGRPLKTFDLDELTYPLHWTPDGRAVAYIDTRNGVSNIRAQPLVGGTPKYLTDFKADRIFWFDWSADGRQLALSRGNMSRDVVLISNFR